jgi:hypothetical protein
MAMASRLQKQRFCKSAQGIVQGDRLVFATQAVPIAFKLSTIAPVPEAVSSVRPPNTIKRGARYSPRLVFPAIRSILPCPFVPKRVIEEIEDPVTPMAA